MSIREMIRYAEQKRNEAFDKGSLQSIVYWDGYLDALKAVKEEIENGKRKADW